MEPTAQVLGAGEPQPGGPRVDPSEIVGRDVADEQIGMDSMEASDIAGWAGCPGRTAGTEDVGGRVALSAGDVRRHWFDIVTP